WLERSRALDWSDPAAARAPGIAPGERGAPAAGAGAAEQAAPGERTAAPAAHGPAPPPRPTAMPRTPTESPAPRAAAPSAELAGAAIEEPGKIEITHGDGDEVNIEFGELLETFRREVQRQVSGDAHSHYALGVSDLEMGLIDQAIESLRAAADDPSLTGTASELIGRCFMDHGRFEEAAAELRNALEQPGVAGECALNLRFELGLALEAA